MAAELKEKGASDPEIESLVERLFKTDGHRDTHDHGAPAGRGVPSGAA